MKLFRFLKSKHFIISLIIALILSFGIIELVFWSLNKVTLHNNLVEVPELKNLSFQEAKDVLKNNKLDIVVKDSVKFNPKFNPKSVIIQYPNAKSKVKPGRKIAVNLNTSGYSKVIFPETTDMSFKELEILFEILDLKIGRVKKVPHFANNIVLECSYKGKILNKADQLPKFSKINVTIGRSSKAKVKLKNLIGLTLKEAKSIILKDSLSLGYPRLDLEVKDSLNAYVYKQKPSPYRFIERGDIVDLWLTNKETKVLDAQEELKNLNSSLFTINDTIKDKDSISSKPKIDE